MDQRGLRDHDREQPPVLLPLVERRGAPVRLPLPRAFPPHRRPSRVPGEPVLDRAEEVPVPSRGGGGLAPRRAAQLPPRDGDLLPPARVVRDPPFLLFHGDGDPASPLLRIL